MLIEQLYKRIGIRKLKDFITPKVIKIDTFKFPKNSALISFLEDGDFPKSTNRLFINSGRAKLYTCDDYIKPKFVVKRNSVKVKQLTSNNKKIDNDFDYVYEVKRISLTPVSKLVILNYNAVDSLFRYRTSKGENYKRVINKFSTVSECLNSGISRERTRFVHVPLNTVFPALNDFKKYATKSEKVIEDYFKTDLSIFMLEIYKLLNHDNKENSAFNKIKIDEMNRIYFIFTYGNQMTLLSYSHLLSAVKEYEVTTVMNTTNGKTVFKLFLLLLLKTIKTNPVSVEDANKDVSEVNGILVVNKTDVGDYKIEDKDIEDILNSEIIETVESNENTDELLDSVLEKETIKDVVQYVDDDKEETSIVTAERMLSEDYELGNVSEKALNTQLELLKNSKFKIKKNDLESFKIDKSETKIKDKKAVLDKSMLVDTISVMDKKYINNQLEQDIDNSFHALSNIGIAVTSHKKIVEESIMGEFVTHEIEVKPMSGRKTKIKIILPKVSEDGTFKISNNTYSMRKQKTDKPIRKINSNRVSLSSFYSKLFVVKHNFKNNDKGYGLYKQLRKASTEEEPDVKMLIYGKSEILDTKLPTDYTTFGRYCKSFKYKNTYFSFNYTQRKSLLHGNDKLSDVEKNKYTIFGNTKTSYMVMDMENNVYEYKNKTYTKIDNLYILLQIDDSKLPIEFASIKMMNTNIPVVIFLLYIYGLTSLLKKLKVKYEIYDISKRILLDDNQYVIRFNDKKIVLTKEVNVKNDLIISGLSSIKVLKEVDFDSLNSKNGFTNLAYLMGLNKRFITEFKMLDSMFIDPVTKDVLVLMEEPTTFRELLIRSCELLVSDYVKHPNSIDGVLIKSYDRMAGLVYKTMITNLKQYENGKGLINNKLSINPYEVLGRLNEDSTVMLIDDLNPIAMLKQVEDVSLSGTFGRNKESIVGEAREYNESDVGIFSEAVKDSSDVGISAYLSASPTINNIRGMVDTKGIKDLDTVNKYSTTTLLLPGNDIDDTKRSVFSSIQFGHVIPLNNAFVLPVRTGYETVIADRVPKKYAAKAKDNGIVISKTKDKLTILYTSNKKENFSLKKWTTKEEANSTYLHEMVTTLNKNDKVEKGDVVIFDKSFFEIDMFDSKSVVMKTGMLLYTQFTDIQTTHEDSVSVSHKMTNKLSTKTTKVKSFIITSDTTINDLVNIGDNVTYHSKLFTMSEGGVEDTEGFELTEKTLAILEDFKNSSPKAKTNGKVEKIMFFYNCNLEEVNETLRKHIEASDKRNSKFTGKVNTSYSVSGTSLMPGEVQMKIYIEKNLEIGIGDKLVFGNQLKCTVSDVLKDDVVTESNVPIEAQFSNTSKDARIVNSPDVIGTATTVLIKLQEVVVKEYFEL